MLGMVRIGPLKDIQSSLFQKTINPKDFSVEGPLDSGAVR